MAAPLRAYLRCNPRDLVEFDLNRALDLIRGEIGADGIAVDVLPLQHTVWRCAAGLSPRTVEREPAAAFQPTAAHYALSRMRPPTAAWMKSSDPLTQIAKACEPRGLLLRARVALCEAPLLAARHPHAACIDAFGDPSRGRVCPMQPDVQAYFGALLEDLSQNHPLHAIDLVEPDFGRADQFHAARENPARRGWENSVLCFCPACRLAAQRAGIDAEGLAQRIASDLLGDEVAAAASNAPGRAFEEAAHVTETDRATDATLAAFHAVRRQAITELICGLRRRCRCDMAIELSDLDPHRGLSPGDAAEYADAWWTGGAAGLDQALAAATGDSPAWGLVWQTSAQHALSGGSGDLVRPSSAAARLGRRLLAFDEFGATPPARLEWIRQAIRFARREAGG